MSRLAIALTATAFALLGCSPQDKPEPANEQTADTMPGAATADANAAAVGSGAEPDATGSTQTGSGSGPYTNPNPTDPADGPESEAREGGGEDRPG